MPDALAIAVHDLHKSYHPGVPVLSDFDFELRVGEVHALVGGNGAGKSTFAKILTGLTPANRGEIQLHGQKFAPANKQEATACGVVMVLQELNVISTLSVAENLFLHDLPHRAGILERVAMRSRAEEALNRVGLANLDPDLPAGRLGVGRQQLIEIAGALAQKSSVLILDEPTAALTGPEIEQLFANVDGLRKDGVAIIYISHRMDEIAQIADRVTVLRDGRRVATHETGTVETARLVREMVGGEVAARAKLPIPDSRKRNVGLRVEELVAGDAVRGVSFEAYRGEILGIAGLIGAGRTETLRAIFGADARDSGAVTLGDRNQPLLVRSPAGALRAGIGLIPEDRKEDGLLLSKSLRENTTLGTLNRYAHRGILDAEAEERAASEVCDRLTVKRGSLDQTAAELSGGNQQKIVIARWLLCDCQVLLFDEPARGIDSAAKETIYGLLDELVGEGKTIVVVSSDLTELMMICHRILVLSVGRITGEFLPETWTRESITAAAFSGYNRLPAES